MRTDKLFYAIFQQFPQLFFELIGREASDAENYQFDTIELKEISLTIDGLLIPQANFEHNPLYFIEVQFQKKANFYQRLFVEIFAYCYQKETEIDWQAVVIFPTKSIEVKPTTKILKHLVENYVIPIYIDEIQTAAEQKKEMDLFRLFAATQEQAKEITQRLKQRGISWLTDENKVRDWVSLIETILVYKYPKMTRKEIEMLFGLTELKDTKVYQEAYEEGWLKGKQEGELKGILEGERKGKREGIMQEILNSIDLGLELKFGSEGVRLIAEIARIKDVTLLQRIRAGIKGAKTVEEIRRIYADEIQ